MMGGLGIGANIAKWSDAEMAEAREFVALYKEIRGTVQEGELYRLEPLGRSNLAAYQYTAKDGAESVAFAFLESQHFGSAERRLRLQGLEAEASYAVSQDGGEPVVRHGATLMGAGFPLTLRGDHGSTLLRLRRL